MKISTSALTGVLAAAVLTFGATASEASITFGIVASSVTDGSPQTFAPETIFGTNFGVGTTGGPNTVNDLFTIITPPPGSTTSQFKSPWDGGPNVNYQNQPSATYFSVGGTQQPSPQSVTFARTITGLTMLLGSIDTYNTFNFTDINGDIHSFTGTDFATAIGAGVVLGTTSALIRFQGRITGMEVISTSAAAEFAVAAVPLPAAGLLMLAGLGGLAASRKLRRRADA